MYSFLSKLILCFIYLHSMNRESLCAESQFPHEKSIALAMDDEEDRSGKAAAGRIPDEFMKAAQEWIKNLKLSLGDPIIVQPQTVHLSSHEDIYSKYETQVKEHPNHISFATGQAEKFLAYELIARTLYQKFHPESAASLKNKCFLRYPSKKDPKDLNEMFERFPVRKDYDTASSAVANYLISASPSLKEDHSNESAIAIFRENDRDQVLDDVIFGMFKEESVLSSLYEEKIRQLLEDFPCSGKGGVLTQVFLPKSAPLHKSVYRSYGYGIPYEGMDYKVNTFFEEYSKGVTWADDPVPQLRFLPSAIKEHDARMIRYTHITPEALQKYAEKVDNVVSGIFEEYKESNLQLFEQMSIAMSVDNQEEKNVLLDKLALQFCKKNDPVKALELVQMITNDYGEKARCMTLVVSGLIERQECELAEKVIQQESDRLLMRQTLLARLGFLYIDHGNLTKIQMILDKMCASPQKNCVLLFCISQFDDQKEKFEQLLSPLFSTNLTELMEQGALALEIEHSDE